MPETSNLYSGLSACCALKSDLDSVLLNTEAVLIHGFTSKPPCYLKKYIFNQVNL